MRLPSFSGQFKRDVKLAEKRGKDMGKLRIVVDLLLAGEQRAAIHCIERGAQCAILCAREARACARCSPSAGFDGSASKRLEGLSSYQQLA